MSEYPSYLIHYGTLGQKWGVRKYQNEDGTWTEEGLRRRRKEQSELYKSVKEDIKKTWFDKNQKQGLQSYKSIVRDSIDSSNLKKLSKNKEEFDKELDRVSILVAGKYANKKLKDIDFNETYKDFVKDMIKDKVYSEIKREEEKKREIKDLPNKIERIKKEDLLTENRYWDLRKSGKSEDEIFNKDKRLRDAADTGLRALDDTWGVDYDDRKKGIQNSDRFWFVCEDQTIGLATIADMANRGKTKEQIINTINDCISIYNNVDYEDEKKTGLDFSKGVFQLAEGRSHRIKQDDYVDRCIKIAKENTLSDAKQSRIHALIASGKSQEEVAKMLGVSTSTVNKYK